MSTNVIIIATGNCMNAVSAAADLMPFVSEQMALVIASIIIVVTCIAYV